METIRTLEDIEKELNYVKEELEPIKKHFVELCNKHADLKKELFQFKLHHKLYHPMEDLKQYVWKDLDSIILIHSTIGRGNEELTPETFNRMDGDDVFYVSEKGYLYYLTNDCQLHYDEQLQLYVKDVRFSSYCKRNYVGFLDIVLSKRQFQIEFREKTPGNKYYSFYENSKKTYKVYKKFKKILGKK